MWLSDTGQCFNLQCLRPVTFNLQADKMIKGIMVVGPSLLLMRKLLGGKYISISVHFSHSVVSDSLQPHGLQHTRLPCPSPTPGAYSNSRPLTQWYHPTILSSVIPFSSCLQSFPASGYFKWVSILHQVAKVLEFQFQHQSFQWIFRIDFL